MRKIHPKVANNPKYNTPKKFKTEGRTQVQVSDKQQQMHDNKNTNTMMNNKLKIKMAIKKRLLI